MKRVAITGIGVVSPLGNSARELMANIAAGRSAVRRLDDPAYRRLTSPLAATAAFDPTAHFDPARLRMLDRASQMALVAVEQAMEQAGLALQDQDRARSGVFVGTGMGGAQTSDEGYQTLYGQQSDRIKPFTVLLAMNSAAAGWIALEYGITGPNMTYSTACSSSAVAIGEAAMRIRFGLIDRAIAGGTEAPCSLGPMKAWEALRTIASEDRENPAASCKPFSRNRSGMVLGEGAAFVVLEEWEQAMARGATVHGELIGYGLATDVAHMTRPSVEGQARAMQLAIENSGVPGSMVDYVNAHGTGTPANDPVETAAIKQVFGASARTLPVSSTKAMHGHLLGAAGALEFIISILAMGAGVIPPTAHLEHPDPECDLDHVPNQARTGCALHTVMSNSFAFGGTNAVLIAQRA